MSNTKLPVIDRVELSYGMKKKVLFLITKSNFGGAQRYVYDLAINLPRGEFDVTVATGGHGTLIDKLQAAKIKVIPIPSLERDVSLMKEVRALIELWQIIRAEKPNILHINSSKAGALGALIGRLAGVPRVVFTAHGWAFNEDRPFWQRLILKKIHWLTVLLAHKTIAVSSQVRRQMNWPFVQSKITVIHNGRTINHLLSRDEGRTFIIEKEPRLGEFRNDFWTMTIAELHPIKRHDAVIEVIKEIAVKEPRTRHIIISDGEERSELERKISENQLQENVFLLGRIDDADKLLKAADVFILASRSEGMPYVLIEALFAGLPIVATEVGGVPEIIKSGVSGLLTPPLDNKALFMAILSLRQDASLREKLGQKAKERSGQFTLELTLERTLEVYRS